jgi:hypothetical protein
MHMVSSEGEHSTTVGEGMARPDALADLPERSGHWFDSGNNAG